jgi:hypothetical protein
MKLFFTPLVLLLMVGTSCQKSAVSPSIDHKPSSALNLQGSANSAITVTNQLDIDLAASGFVEVSTCNGDVLQITGGLDHLEVHETINKNNLSITQHNNSQNLKLVDPATGAVYKGSTGSNVSDNLSFIDGKVELTETEVAILTTPGGKNNSEIKFDLHETFDSSGKMTAFVGNFRSGCK